jgi:hypothetical protein
VEKRTWPRRKGGLAGGAPLRWRWGAAACPTCFPRTASIEPWTRTGDRLRRFGLDFGLVPWHLRVNRHYLLSCTDSGCVGGEAKQAKHLFARSVKMN